MHRDLNAVAAQVHAANERWWQDPATGKPVTRNEGEMFMLMVSELSEAMEGARKDLMDDKLPHRKMEEVEIVDFGIRLLDWTGAKQLKVRPSIETPGPISDNKGQAFFDLTVLTTDLYYAYVFGNVFTLEILGRVFAEVFAICEKFSYDFWGAFDEKMAYNATREDHKPEARLAAGGKKW